MSKSGSSITYGESVPAVEQACKVLVFLANNSGSPQRLIDICKEVGIHNSKGYSILNTLIRFGFVQRNPFTKAYTLGPGLAFLGRKVIDNMDLREIVEPFLKRLSETTGETSLFGILSGEQVFIISKQEGNQPIGVNIGIGHRFHMTAGAHGKAIVACLSDEERKRVLSRKRLYFYGDPSRFKRNLFLRELEQINKTGFAEDRGDLQHGINAVSSAVIGADGEVVGCVILIGTFPEKEIKRFGAMVAETARGITSRLALEIRGHWGKGEGK